MAHSHRLLRAAHAAWLASLAMVVGASAGTIVGTGSVAIWGAPRAYAAWNVLQDAGGGIIGPSEGRPTGLEFSGGRLYMSNGAAAIDHGVTYYAPGAGGSLASPTTMMISGLPSGDPRRFWYNALVTVNTSGTGYGAPAGSPPVLVAVGRAPSGDTGSSAVLTPSGASLLMSPLSGIPAPVLFPRALEYVPSLDQFLVIDGDATPSTSNFRFMADGAGGLGAQVSSFSVTGGIRGVQAISAGFATMLLGMSVQQESLLCLEANYAGLSQPPRLMVYSLAGQQMGATNLLLPGYQDWPGDGFSVDPRSLAVDEGDGLIFVGDRGQGRIYAIAAPSAGTIPAVVLGAGAMLRRRRARV